MSDPGPTSPGPVDLPPVPRAADAPPVTVARWPSETPLFVLVVLVSVFVWAALAVSIVGLAYALFIGLFFFVAHVGFIAHLRGSAVKLGPEQLPDLHARVAAISARLGLASPPEAYLMQAGGSLNALATKLFGTHFIVLFSDLLDACEDDPRAADFVIAHEIGHLRAGHLRAGWLLLPGRLFPFLGGAWSRACEYTADRYGLAAVAEPRAATHGMAVLAAGKQHARRVNLRAFVDQRRDMDGVLMTLGRWLGSHPPLADRVAELDASTGLPRRRPAGGAIGAVSLIAATLLLPVVGGGFLLYTVFATAKAAAAEAAAGEESPSADPLAAVQAALDHGSQSMALVEAEAGEPSATGPAGAVADVAAARTQARADLEALRATAERCRTETGQLPADTGALYDLHLAAHDDAEPLDPFDGERYGYAVDENGYHLWSTGSERPEIGDELVIVGPGV